MLSDIEILDMYFAGGLTSKDAFPAWQRIKASGEEISNRVKNLKSKKTPCSCGRVGYGPIICAKCGGSI